MLNPDIELKNSFLIKGAHGCTTEIPVTYQKHEFHFTGEIYAKREKVPFAGKLIVKELIEW